MRSIGDNLAPTKKNDGKILLYAQVHIARGAHSYDTEPQSDPTEANIFAT